MKKLMRKYAWLKVSLIVLILYVGDASNLICLVQPSYVPLGPEKLHGSGHIYFVPLAAFPSAMLERFQVFYKNKYGLDITILPALSMPREAFNEGRGQFRVEQLVRQLQQMSESSQLDPGSIIIGFTDLDIYADRENWRYAFGYRLGQFAIVSSARMSYPFMDVWPVSSEWQETRVRKMLTKHIAVLYYDLEPSSHCRSPVFGRIRGPQELDFMGEDL